MGLRCPQSAVSACFNSESPYKVDECHDIYSKKQRQGEIMSFHFKRILIISLGGLGGDVGDLFCQRMVSKLCQQYATGEAEKESIQRSLRQCFRILWLDSDEREPTVIPPKFSGQGPDTIHAPTNYKRINSYSGKEILSRLDQKPFAFLKEWVEGRRVFVEMKEADSEAESNRGFGTLNALGSIGLIHNQIEQELAGLKGFELTAAFQNLLKFGLARQDANLGTEIFILGSTAGGQATGLFLPVLGLLGLELRDYVPRPKVRLHLALPGFHAEKAEQLKQMEYFKTLAVLRDLAKIKRGDIMLKLPHPNGHLGLESFSINLSSVNLHQPRNGNNGQKYLSFISQFANTLVDSQLAPFAADLRRDRSNAVASARAVVQEDEKFVQQPRNPAIETAVGTN
jgi:hypothetical protein